MKENSWRRLGVFLLLVLAVVCLFFLIEIPSSKAPHLTVIGFAKMADGLGRQSVELMDGLYDDVELGFIPSSKSDLKDVPERIQHLITQPNDNQGKIVIYESALPSPNEKAEIRLNRVLKGVKNNHQIRIAYSMLESSRIPSKWAELLNKYFDAVVVPDTFLVDVYQCSGVEIPVFVLPLGLDIASFLERPLKRSRNTPFRFVNVSSMVPRKNHEGLIRAFYQAFGDDPEIELHLNYRPNGSSRHLDRIEHLIQSLNVHNIFLGSKRLDHQQYLEFLLQGDALVSLSKGEGFSIQPREAMALGLPVIISNNTAHTTIVKSGLVYAVPCPTTECAYNKSLRCECGEEYVADVYEAAKALRYVYENYETCLESSSQSKQWAAQYQFKNLKPLYLTLVNPSKVVLGNSNELTEGCLTTSSEELYKKYITLTTPK
ncbi:MAG: glycosyltransferase family 4 protein [Simkania sp.]|nr:glycosyltransferase family 4 protein [Simkania sp.]